MFKITSSLRPRISATAFRPAHRRACFSSAGSMITVAIVTLLVVSIAAPAWSESPTLRRQWRQMETPNFVLFGDASERQMRDVGDSLESLRSFLGQVSSSAIEAPVPTYIYVFKDRRSFNPYRFLQPNGDPADITGYFSRRQHANYIAIDGSRRDAMIGITLHEYVHFYLSYRTRNLPVWFNEGLAEVYSTFEVIGDHVNLGKIIPQHLQWLQQNKMIPLLQLFAVDHTSPEYNESDRRGVFYAQSWAMVHYLYLNLEGGPQQLVEFLNLQNTLPPEQAFTQAFGTSPEEMQRRLRKYIRSSYFSYRRAELPIDDLRKSFVFRDMNTSEALARLGELLALQKDRRDEAMEHLQAALAMNPDEIRAHVGIGLLEDTLSGDADSAVEHFAVARRLEPQDRYLVFLHAQAQARNGALPRTLRQDLVRVVNAHPNFSDAWRLLAWSWSGETEHLDEATRVFEGAHRSYPEEQSYAENLLYYYDRTERKEDAENLMQSFFHPRGLSPRRVSLTFNDSGYTAENQNIAQEAVFEGEMQSDPTVGFVQQANQLMVEENYEAALAVYEKLVSLHPNSPDFITKRDELRNAVSHNRFIKVYNEAVRLFGVHKWRQATEELQQLLTNDMSAAHRTKAEKLLAQAKRQWQIRGESGL